MSLYPVNSCIMQSVSVLYFCYETECTITTLFSEEQNTLPKYVTKCNVFCVTYSGFFLPFCTIVKLGSVVRLNFYLLRRDIPSE